MRKFALALLALLALCPFVVQAETIAATATTSGSTHLAQRFSQVNTYSPYYLSPILTAKQEYCPATYGGIWFYSSVNNRCENGLGNASGLLNWNYTQAWGACRSGYTYSSPNCIPVTTYSCPTGQNWTLSGTNCTRPDCTAQQVRNTGTGVCEALPCLSTANASPVKWYDMGTNPDALKKFVCVGSCMALYSGDSVSKSAIVEGVRHYYAYGGYDYSGAGAVDVCTPGAEVPSAPSGTTEIPVSHCASNQIEGLIDGKLNCWNVPTVAGAAPTLANPDAASTTTGTTTTNVVVNGATTTTTTTTSNVGGGTTVITDACTSGNCIKTTATTGVDQTVDPDKVSPGAGAGTTGLYTADTGGKTFSSVLTSFKNTTAAAPVATAAGGFFTAGTFVGSCSALAVNFTMLGYSLSLDATEVFCGATAQQWYGYIATGMLLIATGIAFAIAIL